MHLTLGQLTEALDDLKRAVALLPLSCAAHNDFGVALYESDKPGEALDVFMRALELDSTNEQTRDNVAALKQYLGRT
jgi:lipoprotein NlpI